MPNEKTLAKRQTLAEVANQIDEIASSVQLYEANDGGLAKQLAVATAIVDMRALLTDEVMQPVMALMNTGLGFKTDRDPSRASRGGPTPVPYSVDTVRECVIEAKLRGFNLVGQEFNIIAGGFYACKNGLSRKVRDMRQHGVTKFRDFYDMPVISNDGQSARVKCRAQWEQAGKAEKVEFEFYIKLHGMGADAALGKAERRLAKEVLKFLAGDTTPVGDVEDEPEGFTAAKPAQVEVRVQTAEDDQIPGAETPARNTAPRVGAHGNQGAGSAETASAPSAPTVVVTSTERKGSAQLARVRTGLARDGIGEGAAVSRLHELFPETGGFATLDEIDAQRPAVINAIMRGWVTVFGEMKGGAK